MPVSIVIAPAASTAAAGPTTTAVHSVNADTLGWPNLDGSKPNPGSDDWRALERRAFSLRLRGPFGEIDG